MKKPVEIAIAEIRSGLPASTVHVKPDVDGGAVVKVDDLAIGACFRPAVTWIGFHIVWSYPDADIYPHYLDPSLVYVGPKPTPNQYPEGNLPVPLTRGATLPQFDIPAIQVSRKSNQRSAETDTALAKLLRIIEFLKEK